MNVYKVLYRPERMNRDLLSNDFSNTRGWGMSQATRWRFNTKQRRCSLGGEANEVRNFAARGCWAWWRVTASKKQLRRIMLISSGLGKAWVVNGGMKETRSGRCILLSSPTWSSQTLVWFPTTFLRPLRAARHGTTPVQGTIRIMHPVKGRAEEMPWKSVKSTMMWRKWSKINYSFFLTTQELASSQLKWVTGVKPTKGSTFPHKIYIYTYKKNVEFIVMRYCRV